MVLDMLDVNHKYPCSYKLLETAYLITAIILTPNEIVQKAPFNENY